MAKVKVAGDGVSCWIDQMGLGFNVKESHFKTVCDTPDLFGVTREEIESLGEKVVFKLVSYGWSMIRRDDAGVVTAYVPSLKSKFALKKVSEYLACSGLKEVRVRGIRDRREMMLGGGTKKAA